MLLATVIVLFQLIDAYIRLLAFSNSVSSEKKFKVWRNSLYWAAVCFFLYSFLFANFGINAVTYKAILLIGWLPYFIICAEIIRCGLLQHIFVFGMGTICSLVQHTISTIFVLMNFTESPNEGIILLEATGYLILFAVFLPLFGAYFVKILPIREFFDIRPQGVYIAFLPLVIASSHIILLADDTLVHSSAERLSRMYLPIVFFFFYRYILSATKNFYELQKLKRNKVRIENQLSALKDYNELIQESQTKISVMRHDLRHSYNLIYAMLDSGNLSKAREHIANKKILLEETDLKIFSKLPPINKTAANIDGAEIPEIKTSSKIDLKLLEDTGSNQTGGSGFFAFCSFDRRGIFHS